MLTFPPTTSGAAMIAALSDDEALALCPGDAVVIQTARGLAPLLVEQVRPGIAYDDSKAARAYKVPVVEGWLGGMVIDGERPSVWAVPDCLYPYIDGAMAPEQVRPIEQAA